jgi:hypothetical protein
MPALRAQGSSAQHGGALSSTSFKREALDWILILFRAMLRRNIVFPGLGREASATISL